jgi:peptide/nickel transport system permease protein
MRNYILKRILQMIPVLLLVTGLVFSLLLLIPGDPVRAIIGVGEALDEEQMEAMRQKLGLDKPIPVQYVVWLGKVVRGDFGESNHTNRPVLTEIKNRLPVTIQLGLTAWLLSIIIALPAGIISAMKRGTKTDFVATILSMSGVAIPGFWLGIMLILLFGLVLEWLPTHGFVSLFEDPIEGIRHLILPALSMGLAGAALNMRQTRSAMLEVLAQDYVRTARAKGLKESRVIWIHALKNSLLPVVTIMGLQIGRLFGGTVIIETLFAIPGMGRLMVDSIFYRDFPVVQACVLIVAVTVLVANLITDILYAYLDPRIHYG